MSSLFGYIFGQTVQETDQKKNQEIDPNQWEFVTKISGEELEDDFIVIESQPITTKKLENQPETQTTTTTSTNSVVAVSSTTTTTSENVSSYNTHSITIPSVALVFQPTIIEFPSDEEENNAWFQRQKQIFPIPCQIGLQIKGSWGDVVLNNTDSSKNFVVLMKRKTIVSSEGSSIATSSGSTIQSFKGISVPSKEGNILKGIYIGKQVASKVLLVNNSNDKNNNNNNNESSSSVSYSGSTLKSYSGSTVILKSKPENLIFSTKVTNQINSFKGSQIAQTCGSSVILSKQGGVINSLNGSSIQSFQGSQVFF